MVGINPTSVGMLDNLSEQGAERGAGLVTKMTEIATMTSSQFKKHIPQNVFWFSLLFQIILRPQISLVRGPDPGAVGNHGQLCKRPCNSAPYTYALLNFFYVKLLSQNWNGGISTPESLECDVSKPLSLLFPVLVVLVHTRILFKDLTEAEFLQIRSLVFDTDALK